MPRPPNRTNRVIMTDEARVLKQLRENYIHPLNKQRGLSMREAGELMSWSSTYISHIENGRVNVPENERLDKMLNAYGITKKSFIEKIRRHRKEKEQKPDIEILELIPRLNLNQRSTVKALINHFLNVQK